MDKDRLPLWVVAAVAVIIIAIAVFTGAKFVAFKDDAPTQAGQLVASLFVITVFVERALSILNDIWFGEQREQKERQVHNVGEQLASTRRSMEQTQATLSTFVQEAARSGNAELLAANPPTVPPLHERVTALQEQASALENTMGDAVREVTAVEAVQDQLRLRLGFIFSLLISAVGVRTLDALLDSTGLAREQLWVFHAVDIVLTAGLIAGGSTGINAIADLLGTYVDVSRRKATER